MAIDFTLTFTQLEKIDNSEASTNFILKEFPCFIVFNKKEN